MCLKYPNANNGDILGEKNFNLRTWKFHAREYLRLLRATVPYSNRRDKKKRNACNELCGIGIDVPLEFATKSRLPELAEILLRKLRDARTISSKDSLELQQWKECSAVGTLVERFRPDDCSTCEGGTLMEKRLGGLHGHLTKGLVPRLLRRGGRL
ncbi:hypothetical protein TNCT_233092 [Trichonephila clavata]|uniref:Uncharacterized protein n=1 Tax=Trichonephila clavata TaxID=2740835 RepID=A0A8X6GQP2_TRICU|nr:hypothetical protein TNCT_233092 [Trichonephila clavata]